MPEVTFLGTHFENLKIARHKVLPILNLKLADPKPQNDQLYVADKTNLMTVVKGQYERLADWLAGQKGMRSAEPDGSLRLQYHGGSQEFGTILSAIASARKVDEDETTNETGKSDGITLSLVEDVVIEPISKDSDTAKRDAKELVDGKCGHVIHIPDFGTIFLAELTVNHNTFHLTMIRVEMGCIAAGSGSVGVCAVNGGGGGTGGKKLAGGG